MKHEGVSLQDMKSYEEGMKWHENSMKHWRAWGSWFSWGSPVGLGLFFVEAAACIWILSQAFHW